MLNIYANSFMTATRMLPRDGRRVQGNHWGAATRFDERARAAHFPHDPERRSW